MWNNTDILLAYLTFRSYGTWLHGDKRGSIDRFHNQYRSPYIAANQKWHQHNLRTMPHEAAVLDAKRREAIEAAIVETGNFRDWHLYACNIRTNHVHVVVGIGAVPPERALNAFKANATRQLKQDGRWQHKHSPWADKGSKRYLWNEHSLERAIDYVINGQGDELPEFD